MKKVLTFTFIILFVFITLSAQEKTAPLKKRPMTTDDALNMVRVGRPLISPDGKWVFYSKTELYWEKNKTKAKYYMIPSEGGEAFQYIGEAGGSSFAFSPDGKYFTLMRSVDKKRQIFIMRTAGGEATQLTKHKNSVGSYRWSPNSSRIFFLADEPRSKEEEKEYKAGADIIFVDEGPNGQREGNWRNLWVFDIKTKEETKLTDEKFILGGFDISPDGKFILFSARYTNRRNDGYKNEIYLFDIEKKEKTQLTDNKAPEGGILWAPDGKTFAYTAADDKKWLNKNSKIWIMDPFTKEYRMLSGKFEGNIRGMFWTPDSKYILFNGQHGVNTNVYKIDITTGEYKNLTNQYGSLYASSFSKDRTKMTYTFTDFDSPSDIYAASIDDFKPVRLTEANPWVEKEILLASMKLVQWQSVKNYRIEGLLHLPAGYKQGTKLPLILNIHGGPAGCFTNSFRASYHIYAGLGYASFSPNVRGSSGYTDHLREGNTVQAGDGIGYGDYWDLIKGVDHVIENGYADADKLALRGWSYGGILGGWTITKTKRFKAASIGAGVYDWASEYGPGFNFDVRLWHIGGTPWDNPEAYKKQSTYTHVKNIVTPTLLIHGMNDTTDTEHQSMMLFTAIKDIGKAPVRYLRAPREPHGFREPRHQRTRDIEEIKWMQKYVMGVEWEPWVREKKKDEDKKDEEKKEEEK